MGGHAVASAWEAARQRLKRMERVADPGTIRHLKACGVGAGWHCLEVGAGGGSIAAWLSRRVGRSGSVLATDLDIRFLGDLLHRPNLEVRQHDIAAADLPEAAFDLVHCRAVLAHFPQRDQALDRMVAALKPEGWLVVEDTDYSTSYPDSTVDPAKARLFQSVFAAMDRDLAARGLDLFLGRQLFGQLRRRGLVGVGAEGRLTVTCGGSESAAYHRESIAMLGPHLIATGAVTADELAACAALFDDPAFIYLEPLIIAAWGRRPGSGVG